MKKSYETVYDRTMQYNMGFQFLLMSNIYVSLRELLYSFKEPSQRLDTLLQMEDSM